MKPSVAPSCCSTTISSRRDWMSSRTVLPTTSSAPRPSKAASTHASRTPKRSQRSSRWRHAASCWTTSTSGNVRSESASRVSSPFGVTMSTLGSGLPSTALIASPRPLLRRSSSMPSSGVRSSSVAMSPRPRSSSATARARSSAICGLRNRLICRDCCTVPVKRSTLPSAAHRPSGKVMATAMTPMVSAVAHGLCSMRPALATRL
jgi:hypothetical protein